MMRRAYEVADTMLGAFMEMMDDETVLIALSDHGNVPNKWAVDYARVLESAGLLALDENEGVIWEDTRAFMIPQRIEDRHESTRKDPNIKNSFVLFVSFRGCLMVQSDIYINLKGRFPKGTVDPKDYEKVQEDLIDALLDLRNPDGQRVVAYALKKKDAQLVGYYGPEAGDVVFVFNSFHGRSRLPKGVCVQRATSGSNYGPQIATTRTGFSSNLAVAVIAGPGIRRGYVRDDETQGLWKLTDIVPTIAHMLGFPPPRDARGGVMYDLFQT